MTAEFERQFGQFWPLGCPFPPAYAWVAARHTRLGLKRRTWRLLQATLAGPASAQGDDGAIESESIGGAIRTGLLLGTALVVVYIAYKLAEDDSESDEGKADDEDGEEGEEAEGLWNPDGTGSGGGKPVWQ